MSQEYQKQLQHLTTLGRLPAWKEHVWHRLQELEKMPGFQGIKEEAVAMLKKPPAAQAAAAPSSTQPC